MTDLQTISTQTLIFNSASFCMGSSGVDAFNYNWGFGAINWLFPPPRLIVKTINHLKNCNGIGVLLTPEWKSASFFPVLNSKILKPFIKNKIYFDGQNIFLAGADKSSFFGPNFQCRVILWHFDFNIFNTGRAV